MEGGGGGVGGEAGLDELVGVALESEALVGGSDLVGGAGLGEAEDLVVAARLRRRRRHGERDLWWWRAAAGAAVEEEEEKAEEVAEKG